MSNDLFNQLPPDKQTLRSYDINAAAFAARYETAEHGEMLKHLTTVFTKGDRVLSLGCGSGKIEAFLLSHGIEVTATDGSIAMLTEARRIHPALEGRLAKLVLPERFPFADGELDGVLAITVLMHLPIEGVVAVAGEISRTLKAGSQACVSVIPDRPDLNGMRFDPQGRFYNELSAEIIDGIFARYDLLRQSTRADTDALSQGVSVDHGVYRKAA